MAHGLRWAWQEIKQTPLHKQLGMINAKAFPENSIWSELKIKFLLLLFMKMERKCLLEYGRRVSLRDDDPNLCEGSRP
jgi:hypothetical protein